MVKASEVKKEIMDEINPKLDAIIAANKPATPHEKFSCPECETNLSYCVDGNCDKRVTAVEEE